MDEMAERSAVPIGAVLAEACLSAYDKGYQDGLEQAKVMLLEERRRQANRKPSPFLGDNDQDIVDMGGVENPEDGSG